MIYMGSLLPFKWFVLPFESWTEVTAGETTPLKSSIFLNRDRQKQNIRLRPSPTWGLTPHCERKNPKEYRYKRKIYFYKCISLPNSLIMWSLGSWWIGLLCFNCLKDLVDKNCKLYLWMVKSKMESSLTPLPSRYTIDNICITNKVFALFCISFIQNEYVIKWCPIFLATLCFSLPAAAPMRSTLKM